VFVAVGCGGADVTAAGVDGGMGVTCSSSVERLCSGRMASTKGFRSARCRWAAERRVPALRTLLFCARVDLERKLREIRGKSGDCWSKLKV